MTWNQVNQKEQQKNMHYWLLWVVTPTGLKPINQLFTLNSIHKNHHFASKVKHSLMIRDKGTMNHRTGSWKKASVSLENGFDRLRMWTAKNTIAAMASNNYFLSR